MLLNAGNYNSYFAPAGYSMNKLSHLSMNHFVTKRWRYIFDIQEIGMASEERRYLGYFDITMIT